MVALFMRAWIEIVFPCIQFLDVSVALFMRAWIEIDTDFTGIVIDRSRPLHEGVD